MSTTETGRNAEAFVARQLQERGFKIISQNWRTRWCEIDIVATKDKQVVFFEVKYRKSSAWGDGLDAITDKKLQQMHFAAEMWVQSNNWSGDYSLAAVSVTGEPPRTLEIIEI